MTRAELLAELNRLNPRIRCALLGGGGARPDGSKMSARDARELRCWLSEMAARSFDDPGVRATDEEALLRQIDPSRLPSHVAIIMDGNGRWAASRNRPRIAGHRAGAGAVRRTVETAAEIGLECLTLYAFSTENWKRPRFEVRALMDLLIEYLRKELRSLRENNISFRMIGRHEGMHQKVLDEVHRAELATGNNTGLRLNIAINYGGRTEIVDAIRKLASEVAAGRLNHQDIDERIVSANLYTHPLPDPDLLIRTGGEMRVSNFLLWQIAYSEIYVTEKFWPDFGKMDLLAALIEYQKRHRRFGAVEQNKIEPAVAASGD